MKQWQAVLFFVLAGALWWFAGLPPVAAVGVALVVFVAPALWSLLSGRRRRVRRLVAGAMAAADAHDPATSERLAREALAAVGPAPSRPLRREAAWACWVLCRSLTNPTNGRLDRARLDRARDLARQGLGFAEGLDPIDRVLIRPYLYHACVGIEGLREDYEAQSTAIAEFTRNWAELEAQHEVQAVLAANPGARGLVSRTLAETSGACLSSLRVHEAKGFVDRAMRVAQANDDQDSLAWAHVRSLPVAQMLLDDASVAMSVGWLRAAGGLRALPDSTSRDGLLIAASNLAEAEAWRHHRAGDFVSAAAAFERMSAELAARSAEAGRVLANLLALRRAVELVEAGALDEARAVLGAVDAFGQLVAGESDVALEALVLLAAREDDPGRAVECARHYLSKAERLPLGTGTLGEALGYLAWAAAATGDGDLAVAAAGRAASSMVLTSSGRLPAAWRSHVQDGQRRVRDLCLSALSGVGTPAAAAAILDVLGAWRDQTLRDLTLEHLAELPAGMRDALVEIDAQLTAFARAERQGDASMAQARDALDASRRDFAAVAGEEFALLAAPHPLRPRRVATPTGAETWVVATLVAHPVRRVVTVVLHPAGAAESRTVPVDEATADMLDTLSRGLVASTLGDVRTFHAAWARSRHRIAHGLGLDLVLDGPVPAGRRRVRFVLDSALENVPVGDLPVDGAGTPLTEVADIAWSEFIPAEEPVAAQVGVLPSVLAFHFGDAQDEAAAFRRLAGEGVIALTEAASLGDVRARLAGGEAYDALVVSSHGSGAGLDYRFHEQPVPAVDDREHVLRTHELVGARVPPVVVAAACSSAVGGTRDITGLLATLLANGARQVACAAWELPNDETVDLLTRLVRRMPAQPDLARALQEAKADARSEPDEEWHRGPYWWEGLRVVER